MQPIEKALNEYLKDVEAAHQKGDATEHTYRPALQTLLESMDKNIAATNEPKRIACGAPDFIIERGGIPIGFVEAKDIGKNLGETLKSDQLKRYLDSLPNLILTDYLEFRLYHAGEFVTSARVGSFDKKGKLKTEPSAAEKLHTIFEFFQTAKLPTINTPSDLAERMASIARLLCEVIEKNFEQEDKGAALHEQFEDFRRVLLHDLQIPEFADMYAQTICYGLFAARCNHNGKEIFSRKTAAHDLPETNPFLREMFVHIAGPKLDARLAWLVDHLTDVLNYADIALILKDFGKRTRQEDPIVHFYEKFLQKYDPSLREGRGVYYTPEPVVSYIVRSVDILLKERHYVHKGLIDTKTIPIYAPKKKHYEKLKQIGEYPKVYILDPAVGTGTFLHGVINHIHEQFVQANNEGMWNDYVTNHLLPRLFGFELLMAPYTVCHMKLGIQLAGTGYDFKSNERLKVYLTNTLEKAFEHGSMPLFASIIAKEANEAGKIKNDTPVMVVIGNPPYSGHSANKSEWMDNLMRGNDTTFNKITEDYFKCDGKPLGERNPKWLNDDYVKFIRFAQWRIEQTGYGILAFITNHGYLDNPTFRGMRQSLMNTFDEIYILDLHGNSKKKEIAPDGSKDENVFDIQQGVSIGIFSKHLFESADPASVFHAEIWGAREIYKGKKKEYKYLSGGKYKWLAEHDKSTTKWAKLKPQSPNYLFVPMDRRLLKEFQNFWKITDIMPVNSVGIVTARDKLSIHFTKEELWKTVKDFAALPVENARDKYNLGDDVRDWNVKWAQNDLKQSGLKKDFITPILYRPFDLRCTYYTAKTKGFHCMPRGEVMHHMLAGENVGLSIGRAGQVIGSPVWDIVTCTSTITEFNLFRRGGNNLFPLYLYPEPEKDFEDIESYIVREEAEQYGIKRRANLSSGFVKEFSEKLKLKYVPAGKGDLKKTVGPEDFFDYMYAVFHSPSYRERYAEFLKMDFPRVPLTENVKLFRELCGHGSRLKELHLMKAKLKPKTKYPVKGDNLVDKPHYDAANGRVYINDVQYVEGVPERVWEFHIGGYQVCHKWLKDRKGRALTFEDLEHYQYIVTALGETMSLMEKVDKCFANNGGWPLGLAECAG